MARPKRSQRTRLVCPLTFVGDGATAHPGILAPRVMRADDWRRFCPDCTVSTGRLVRRVRPADMTAKAKQEANRAARKAAADADRVARKVLAEAAKLPPLTPEEIADTLGRPGAWVVWAAIEHPRDNTRDVYRTPATLVATSTEGRTLTLRREDTGAEVLAQLRPSERGAWIKHRPITLERDDRRGAIHIGRDFGVDVWATLPDEVPASVWPVIDVNAPRDVFIAELVADKRVEDVREAPAGYDGWIVELAPGHCHGPTEDHSIRVEDDGAYDAEGLLRAIELCDCDGCVAEMADRRLGREEEQTNA